MPTDQDLEQAREIVDAEVRPHLVGPIEDHDCAAEIAKDIEPVIAQALTDLAQRVARETADAKDAQFREFTERGGRLLIEVEAERDRYRVALEEMVATYASATLASVDWSALDRAVVNCRTALKGTD